MAIGLFSLGICGCDSEVFPTEEQREYPHTIVSNEIVRVVVPNKGDDPVVIFGIRRKASEQLNSFECTINDVLVSLERVEVTAGQVWDRDDILPEGVVDLFSLAISERGQIEVSIFAEYNTGVHYSVAVAFEYMD